MSQTLIAILVLCFITCITGQTDQTECQTHRARAQKSKSVINLVPNCEPNGQYSALQCHSESKWCQCWTPSGHPVTQPSRDTKRCECILDRHTKQTKAGHFNPNGLRAIGAFIPKCEKSGHYSKEQCHGSTGFCWCVDETGAQVGEQIRGDPKCQ